MGRVSLFLLFFLMCSIPLFADWQGIDWPGQRIISLSTDKDGAYVLSDRYLYEVSGAQISRICRIRGGEDVRLWDVKVGGEFVYWSTSIGLFRAPKKGGRAERLFNPEGGVIGLDVWGDRIFVGGERAVYEMVEGQTKELFKTRGAYSLKFVPAKDLLVVLSNEGITFWKVSEGRRIKTISISQGEDALPIPRSIALIKGRVFVLSRSSVYEVKDGSLALVFDYPGQARGLVPFGDRLFCYGNSGVYDVREKVSVNSGLEDTDVVAGDSLGDVVLIATAYRMYRWQEDDFAKIISDDSTRVRFLLRVLEWEPSILDLQREAMEYANVSPEKIRDWKERLHRRALLPKFKVDVDLDTTKSVSDSVAVSSSGAENVGPDDKTVYKASGLGLSLEWDLGDLVWSDEEISIDTRSKLTVELRDDILDQVNQLYFERRRLITKFILSPPKDKEKLLDMFNRLQHLRADIDGLTGGYLTKRLAEIGREDWERQYLLSLMEVKDE